MNGLARIGAPDMTGPEHFSLAVRVRMKRAYSWIYTPTGERGSNETEQELTREEVLDLINRWNCLGQGKWVYWY